MPNKSPVNALMPAVRAALERAYQHGRADARSEFAKALGVEPQAVATKPVLPHKTWGPRAAYGSQQKAVKGVLTKSPQRFSDIQRAASVKSNAAANVLKTLVLRGVAEKVAPGFYALRPSNGHAVP